MTASPTPPAGIVCSFNNIGLLVRRDAAGKRCVLVVVQVIDTEILRAHFDKRLKRRSAQNARTLLRRAAICPEFVQRIM